MDAEQNVVHGTLTGKSQRTAARHRKARVFAWVCGIATWTGVVILAVLLIDVITDSSGWILSRVDKDSRMFMQQLESDPGFRAHVESVDAKLFKKYESKLKSKRKRAENDGRTLTAADEIEILQDVLHSETSKDPEYFTKYEMQPTGAQRMSVLGQMITEIVSNFPSRHPSKAGYKSALAGTIWLFALTALMAIPIGIAAAVYLEEYAPKNRLNRFIEVNISNLAGVPSIVYGILGLAIFVRWMGMGRSVTAGAATMSLLILPVIIIAGREALKAVPDSIRQGGFALGATRWQVTRDHVLPSAIPGILTGVILAMSRAIGETAPMIMIGALSYVAFIPKGPGDDFTVMPIQIYNWIAMPQKEFHLLAACGILILLTVLLAMNSIAVIIRRRAQRSLKW